MLLLSVCCNALGLLAVYLLLNRKELKTNSLAVKVEVPCKSLPDWIYEWSQFEVCEQVGQADLLIVTEESCAWKVEAALRHWMPQKVTRCFSGVSVNGPIPETVLEMPWPACKPTKHYWLDGVLQRMKGEAFSLSARLGSCEVKKPVDFLCFSKCRLVRSEANALYDFTNLF